jgi:hypothetical protein
MLILTLTRLMRNQKFCNKIYKCHWFLKYRKSQDRNLHFGKLLWQQIHKQQNGKQCSCFCWFCKKKNAKFIRVVDSTRNSGFEWCGLLSFLFYKHSSVLDTGAGVFLFVVSIFVTDFLVFINWQPIRNFYFMLKLATNGTCCSIFNRCLFSSYYQFWCFALEGRVKTSTQTHTLAWPLLATVVDHKWYVENGVIRYLRCDVIL